MREGAVAGERALSGQFCYPGRTRTAGTISIDEGKSRMDKRQPLKEVTDSDEVRLLHLLARMRWKPRPDHSYLDLTAARNNPNSRALSEVERCFNKIMRGECEGYKAREYLAHIANELIAEIDSNPKSATEGWRTDLVADPWEPWRDELFRTGWRVWLTSVGPREVAGLQELSENYYSLTD
jgi:hypothetical protein